MKIKAFIASAALMASLALSAQQAKYIFYYIGDGMGMGPSVSAETYNRVVRGNSTPLTMMQMPVVGWCMTYSASSPVTDSAAAGTALSTGYKTLNGMLGMTPDSTAVTSVAVDLAKMGYGIGVATSVAPDDATPGAFFAHVPSRKMSYEIDCQMAESGYNFVAGGGLRGLTKDGKDTDALERFQKNGVQIVYGPDEIEKITSDKVVLLNPKGAPSGNVGYTIDSIAGVLNLPLIAETCLKQLERTSPDKFFMMIEGGNIDHALHANDGGAAVKEIVNFNQALDVAFEFYKKHPDETLIVVTADHDTGGMSLNAHNEKGLFYIDLQKISKEEFNGYCKSLLKSRNVYTWDDMRQYLADNLGLFRVIPVSGEKEAELKDMFDRTFNLRNTADQKTLYANFNAFAVDVFKIFNNAVGFRFTATGHSGNPVPVFAIGVGADRLKGFNNNTDIPGIILEAAKGK